jgi:hypothetical protein
MGCALLGDHSYRFGVSRVRDGGGRSGSLVTLPASPFE